MKDTLKWPNFARKGISFQVHKVKAHFVLESYFFSVSPFSVPF